MANRTGGQRELVFCHSCRNDWYRDQHGLQCPQCESEFVEVIEQNHDPREANDDEPSESPPLRPLSNPLRDHDPWREEAPDPDEGDIEHVEWNGPGGIHFSRTSYRSTSPGMVRAGHPPPNDPFALFQTVTQMMTGRPGLTSGADRRGGPAPPDRPGMAYGTGQYGPPGAGAGPDSAPRSPLQEGPSRHGFEGRNTYTTTTRLWPRDANNAQPQVLPVDDLHGLLGNLLQGIHGTIMTTNTPGHPANPNAPPLNPFQVLQQMFNPANASHGDVVYTQEALDRVISQLMEQHAGSSAPGPASASAIAALPKKQIDASMLGSDGKAECSVCMDNVLVGDEVTVLPCSHWFHGDCVGAWLKEHDTCPHCRQGIMPNQESANSANGGPRTPGQAPRNSQNPWASSSSGGLGSGLRGNPFGIPETSPGQYSSREGSTRSMEGSRSRPDAGRRRSTGGGGSGGGGGGGGITGWVSRHLGGGGNN